ncbi:MAG TPA: endo-1,4-beta-xylanase [Tepidisphaeraceae bacterium]
MLIDLNRKQTVFAQIKGLSPVRVLPEDSVGLFALQGAQQDLGSVQIVPVQGQSFHRALRVSISAGSRTEWNVQIRTANTTPIAAGDVILARFWVRCEESMTGEAFTTFLMELSKPEWEKSVELRASGNKEWRQYSVPFKSLSTFAAGEAQFCFRLGFDRQTIDIGGVEILNYGKAVSVDDLPRTRVTYSGREADAEWRQEALARIEKLRKGDLQLKLTDKAGKPIAGAKVHVKMLRHAFGFGSAVAAEELLGNAPDNRHYRDAFERLFNRAVFENDMKWPQCHPEPHARLEAAMTWLAERQITVRGHCLIWPSWRWLPRDLKALSDSPAELRQRCVDRVSSMVSQFRGRVNHWDVINEPYANHDLMDLLGNEVMIDWFKLAREADPQCKLVLNDYGIVDGGGSDRAHQDHFYDAIKYLKDNGAPIDGVGIQSHFGMVLTAPAQLLRVLDRFSEFGLPIESTEVSLNISDRALQADFMRDYMIAVFSHPNVHGIMLWGFWEGRHWRPEAALYDHNWNLRPHGQVWVDLVHKQWKTDLELKTDGSGRAQVRGFCGDYELTIDSGGIAKVVRIDLPHEGRQVDVIVD